MGSPRTANKSEQRNSDVSKPYQDLEISRP